MGIFDELRWRWKLLCEEPKELWLVLHGLKHPEHTSIHYNRLQLIAMGSYPTKAESRSFLRRAWNFYILLQINFFFVTTVYALPESENFIAIGQDLLWNCGMIYLMTKWHFLYFCSDQVDDIVTKLDDCHREAKKTHSVVEIRAQQRSHFVVESSLSVLWFLGVCMFVCLITTLPLYTNQKLPFHAIYPFNWQDPELHPYGHIVVYIWQCFAFVNNMLAVLSFDLLSAHMFTQLAANLKILSIELRCMSKLDRRDEQHFRAELRRLCKFHQRVLGLIELTNKVFYVPMIMQMVVSFFLISLSTFISLVARHDPSVAARFILFMVLCFLHLSYWCITGNMVNEHAHAVAGAAYDAYEWSPHVPAVQRDISFMIRRAQKAISMGANPFPPLNLTSYMAILKQCYSILTLMLESLD